MSQTTALQHTSDVAQPADETPVATVTPRVDVLESDDDLLVLADMPGVAPGDVDVRFENGELTVHGRRAVSRVPGADVWNYYRAFRVNERIAVDQIEADLRNGVLTLKLPKVEAVKPRRIAVKG